MKSLSQELMKSYRNLIVLFFISYVGIMIFFASYIKNTSHLDLEAINGFINYEMNEIKGEIEEGKNIEKIPELYKELKNLREKEFDEEIRRELSKDKKEELKKYSDSIEKCLKIIGEKYDKNITLDEITKEVAVSKNYFCYLFKKEMGMSLWSYLTQVRLDKAKELLKNTDMKTYEIAFKVGYDNPSYFSKIFKKIENMTPNEYREKII